ncbi:MAG TPA: beta-N-acetylhexosaminidase [bacterium]|uniref:Glycosyl hydrolase family 20, catalytic domain n=1 Tax=candidate division TA06 bacterium ADurb.Bin417 TaxID=1852828 RepID=A0A1V5MKE5_UNCT6|nr:MAG: Glycosyl hydrolase family 20, catalytic domain [candidate division TA06 bacterium ADurb.Bin417]HNQ35600.1 beta-N-acetylhexosaminidase [bacterium]HNS48108.1 beta-N-acetylhexosaminidase [bacterium]
MSPKICFVNIEKAPAELRAGLKALGTEYPVALKPAAGAFRVDFRPANSESTGPDLEVRPGREGLTVTYRRPIHAFRALGRLLAAPAGKKQPGFSETAACRTAGVMWECSRNGVLTLEAAKALLRRMALMGLNLAMLYTEDTYEVPGEPFFGYLRGRYTRRELKEIDDYAAALGIEMIPCIQALGHLAQILQWSEAYRSVTDTSRILLVGADQTYRLLEKMIAAASAPFRSRRIHVGMDEAHGLGTGYYKTLNGERRTFDIMTEHLKRVVEICRKQGLQPMMWSDMFFRIGSARNSYYDLEARIPDEVAGEIPAEMDLVYWDYYNTDPEIYRRMITRHRSMGKDPIVAPGAWNWNRFWPALPFAFKTLDVCLGVCREEKIKEIFITTWGDNGMENDTFSTLPALQYFAEHIYQAKFDRRLFERNFRAAGRGEISDYLLASRLDYLPGHPGPETLPGNHSKRILWDDPLLGLCEPLLGRKSLRPHYRDLAEKLATAARQPGQERLDFPAQLARTLALKCDCRKNLAAAYRAGDRRRLKRLLKEEVQPLRREMEKLWKTHRRIWLDTYKPFGLEALEIRYGGQLVRLQTLLDRLQDYLAGRTGSIPELETRLLAFTASPQPTLGYRRIATPTADPG